jgi:SAM-dependent methyltransferase
MLTATRRGLFALAYLLGRTGERAAQVFFHAAAGATRLDDLRNAIQREWDAGAAIDWERYTATGLAAWEDAFYSRHLHPGERVLVVGCGTGRELVALIERGFRAEGVDVAPECARLARQALADRGLAGQVHTAAIEELSLPGDFDAIVFAALVYSLIPQASRRVAVLRRVARHLRPGGRILVTYLLPAGPPARPVLIELARAVAALTRSDWRPEHGDVLIPAGRRMFTYFEHRFAPAEAEREVESAGLRIVAHETDSEGKLVAVP